MIVSVTAFHSDLLEENVRTGRLFADFLRFSAEFARQNPNDLRLAESSLALPESGTGPFLDTVNGCRSARAVNCVDNLPFRDIFTAADDPPERWMPGDEPRAVSRRHPMKPDPWAALGIEVGIILQRDIFTDEFHRFFGDCETGGQTGRLNSEQIDQTGRRAVDHEFAPFFDCPKSGELPDNLLWTERGQKAALSAQLTPYLPEPARCPGTHLGASA